MKWLGVAASIVVMLNPFQHRSIPNQVRDDRGERDSSTSLRMTEDKYVALTFDADMTQGMKTKLEKGTVKSWINRELIDYLEKEKIEATIFVTGMWAELYPNELKELAKNELFEIGNHSYDHPGFSQPCYTLRFVSEPEKKLEISKTQNIIKEITGAEPKLFRFPGGCASKSDRALVEKLGLEIVDWDISSADAFNNNEQKIAQRVVDRAKDGSVIVFHLHGGPNAPKTAQALKIIVPALREKGFGFKKVSDL